jgi:DNA-binding transcriptional LysR family regulator
MNTTPHGSNRLKQLRAFCLAAQTNNISKAAEKLMLSQPSVSLLIKSLEQDLQVQLFERRGPRISVTPYGMALYEIAQPLVESVEQIPELFAARMGKVNAGEIHIAAGESTILYLLPKYIKTFREKYEKVSIHLHNVTGRDGMALLREGVVDFVVGSLSDIPEDVTYTPIFSYRPMLITPKDHPLAKKQNLTLKDISRYGLILPPRHLSTWRMVNTTFKQHNLDYHVNLEAGGWEVVKKYVSLGMGISIVTEICLSGEEDLAEIALDQFFPSRSYGIVARKGKVYTPQARKFIEMMDKDFFTRIADHAT